MDDYKLLQAGLNALAGVTKDLGDGANEEQVRNAARQLPAKEKEAVVAALNGRPQDPDQTTSNRVWLIIIWAFSAVMLGSVLVLAISVFQAPVTGGTKPEIILTVFTTVTAFLAGLFAPSPVAKKDAG